MNAQPRRWLITGASSGFGRALAEAVVAAGDAVVATARNPAALADLAEHPAATVLALDVTDGAQVRDVVARGRRDRRRRRARQLRGPRPDRRLRGADRRRVPWRAGDEPVRRAGRDESRAAAHARARQRAHRAAELDGRGERQPGPRRVRDVEVRAGRRVRGAGGRGGAVRHPGDDRRARPVPHRLRGTLDAALHPDGRLRGHPRAGGPRPVPRPGRRAAERPGEGRGRDHRHGPRPRRAATAAAGQGGRRAHPHEARAPARRPGDDDGPARSRRPTRDQLGTNTRTPSASAVS